MYSSLAMVPHCMRSGSAPSAPTCLVLHSRADYNLGEIVSVLRMCQTMEITKVHWQETRPTLLEAAPTARKLLHNIRRQGAPPAIQDAPRPPKIPEAARVPVCDRTSAEKTSAFWESSTRNTILTLYSEITQDQDARSTWILQARAITALVPI